MSKPVVHYIKYVDTVDVVRGFRIRLEYACKRSNVIRKGKKPLLFTNHEPGVTCKQCLKKREGKES